MVFKIFTVALLAMVFWVCGANADRLYTWTDDKGVVHITKSPPPPKAKVDNVIHYTPQSAEQIRTIQQQAEKQQSRDDETGKPAYEKKAPDTKAENVKGQEPDVYYQYDGGRYTRRVRRYERKEALGRHPAQLPVKRPRRLRSGRHK